MSIEARLVDLQTGEYTGTISELKLRQVRIRDVNVDYLDVYIALDNFPDVRFKISYPFSKTLTKQSQLGQLVSQIREPASGSELIDVESLLMGRRVKLYAQMEQGFLEAVKDTVKIIK